MEDLRSGLERRACSLTDVAIIRLAWCFGIALGVALLHPAPAFTAIASALLGLASLVSAVTAAIAREPMLRQEMGRWDVAAILYVLSRLVGWCGSKNEVAALLLPHGI